MIIDNLFVMVGSLFIAGYRPPKKKGIPFNRELYLTLSKVVVEDYKAGR